MNGTTRSILVCFAALLLAPLTALRAADAQVQVSHHGPTGHYFSISVDRPMWAKFGLQYPATYVFRVKGVARDWEIWRRGRAGDPGVAFQKTPPEAWFNGIECVRFDQAAGKLYVSAGFKARNTMELELRGVESATFESVAKYYDGRKAVYTLSLDNWGCARRAYNPHANSGAPWNGETDDASDVYQAALHVCRSLRLPVSIAINSRMIGGDAMWRTMQAELDRRDASWEPAVHGQTHPMSATEYKVRGYRDEILGCRDDLLRRLRRIPYGQFIFTHILTGGYEDATLLKTSAREFLFLRGFNWRDNPTSTAYASWSQEYGYYGVGGRQTKNYDLILMKAEPHGRFTARHVAELNGAFDEVYQAGGIFYGLWHPDRYRNSVVYDSRPGVDGVSGSTLMQHLSHVANRKDVWYVANGWLYAYRYVAEHAQVTPVSGSNRKATEGGPKR